ncbi:hypothetical protein PRIC1_008951 [Phytophthora ramorum]|uniref:Uncharacterized protein n=1 Tax=Phytophthora ramorum TaxID=164328 RepID=H3GHC9_PHYRM|nr:hypothetical protein KRP23_6295 [Phytophthora ramorum]KAH7505197.1 hypothetical protein KRP22_5672 [Phytophthora ramorum]
MASSSPSDKLRTSSDDGDATAARGFSKRGDGFSVQETEGLLQEVRDRWQEGWEVITEVHNAQFPGHKRTSGSLKRKFSKLYRMKVDGGTKEKHARAAALAKKVREEMRAQRRGLGVRGLSEDLPGGTDGVQDVHEELSEVEIITAQSTQGQALVDAATEHDLGQLTQGTGLRDDAWQAAINRWPIAGERLRTLRTQIASNEPASSQDLVQTVLLVLLESQHQRDLEREQEREDRRLEKQRWLEEIREQHRRHEQERVEDRRRNEQFMQVMTTVMAQLAQQQRGGLN